MHSMMRWWRVPGELVGRDVELGCLRRMLADLLAGRGGLALLVGEPGIGKTRIAQEFAAVAAGRGTAVLWGRCYEGEGSSPYAPWADALGAYARDVDPARLSAELGAGASVLARLVPEIHEAPSDVPPPARLNPEEERA